MTDEPLIRWDWIEGADLGSDDDGLLVDFNYA